GKLGVVGSRQRLFEDDLRRVSQQIDEFELSPLKENNAMSLLHHVLRLIAADAPWQKFEAAPGKRSAVTVMDGDSPPMVREKHESRCQRVERPLTPERNERVARAQFLLDLYLFCRPGGNAVEKLRQILPLTSRR